MFKTKINQQNISNYCKTRKQSETKQKNLYQPGIGINVEVRLQNFVSSSPNV
jgi:hypothetical protein